MMKHAIVGIIAEYILSLTSTQFVRMNQQRNAVPAPTANFPKNVKNSPKAPVKAKRDIFLSTNLKASLAAHMNETLRIAIY